MYSLVIVEDERTERDALVRLVPWAELGFEVTQVFRDGAECLEYLQENVPDVILTDICMTRVSGLEIARTVRERELPTQIVLMSGYKEFDYAQKAIEFGVYQYLVKPMPLPKLKEAFAGVRKKLEGRSGAQHRAAEPEGEQQSPKYGKSIDRVMRYIEEHYREDLSLNMISEKLYLNPGYVSRMLKEQTGKNYTDIVAGVRIRRAVWLLENTNMYVYEIAGEVGYQNLKYFYRIFKKVTGKAPNDYREEP